MHTPIRAESCHIFEALREIRNSAAEIAIRLSLLCQLAHVFAACRDAQGRGQCVVAKLVLDSWVSRAVRRRICQPHFNLDDAAWLRRPALGGAQMGVYEDNFGFWDIDRPEERALFEHVLRQSVYITCERCERSVRLIPPKTLCATCVSALECGAPTSMNEYGHSQTTLLDPRRPPRWALLSPIRQVGPGRGDSQNERMTAQRSSSYRPQDHRIRSRSGYDHKGRRGVN